MFEIRKKNITSLTANFVKHPFTRRLSLLLGVMILLFVDAQAASARFRVMWRSSPSSSMVVAWDQISGTNPVLFYDTDDHGQSWNQYRYQQEPDKVVQAKSMNNHFVRLEQLIPNTVYYFVVKDSGGTSKRFSFKTAPATINARLSIIAGSDSRNHRTARCNANLLVSKLRPHCVMFGGDMTNGDTDDQWKNWMDDWQLTIGSDGRIFPIIVARGNHEASNNVLVNLFDVPSSNVYYGLTLGGNLLRLYTLNTMIPGGGEQRDWLGRDLQAHQSVIWRLAQYHQAMQPHNGQKPAKEELIFQWATLFHKYQVQVVVESDAHTVKSTWPIRPSRDVGSTDGFIRDDATGTVYVGEGGWGAPLREANDVKPWTRSNGSFNQFKWIFVDANRIEVRTVKTDGAGQVGEVRHNSIFEAPYGLVLWNPKEGDVIRINNPNPPSLPPPVANQSQPQQQQNTNNVRPSTNPNRPVTNPVSTPPPSGVKSLSRDATGSVAINYALSAPANVDIILISEEMRELARLSYPNQTVGEYVKSLDLSKAPSGKYNLIIKANGKLVIRYAVEI